MCSVNFPSVTLSDGVVNAQQVNSANGEGEARMDMDMNPSSQTDWLYGSTEISLFLMLERTGP